MEDTVVFHTAAHHARPVRRDELPALQALVDANPGYSLLVNGVPPPADWAVVEFEERPPAHLSWSSFHFLGLYERAGPVPSEPEPGSDPEAEPASEATAAQRPAAERLMGVAVVVGDLGAPAVWHVALYFIETAQHGTGVAPALYDALEDWVRREGARWLRLGVVERNARALRFWLRQGYRAVRTREGDTGGRVNTTIVMIKPLRAGEQDRESDRAVDEEIAAYLTLVPRDQPGSTLP